MLTKNPNNLSKRYYVVLKGQTTPAVMVADACDIVLHPDNTLKSLTFTNPRDNDGDPTEVLYIRTEDVQMVGAVVIDE